MSKIYKNQDALRLTVDTDISIAGATVREIRYKKPDNTTGHFDATALVAADGTMYYDFVSGDLNQSGGWVFWAYVTFADGRSAPGESFRITVYEEGT